MDRKVCKDGIYVNKVCYSENKNSGNRSYMEDEFFIAQDILKEAQISLFCVMDGHGGKDAATFVKEYFESEFRKLYKKS